MQFTCNEVWPKWAAEETEKMPRRTMVYWMMDANAKMGVRKGENGPALTRQGAAAGAAYLEVESAYGDLFREWMGQQHPAAVNAHEAAGGGSVPRVA